MSVDENKAAVTAFLERFAAGDVDGVLGGMRDDATWRVMGRDGGGPCVGDGFNRLVREINVLR